MYIYPFLPKQNQTRKSKSTLLLHFPIFPLSMAHRPIQRRRNSAPPESTPSPSTVSAPARHPKPTTTTTTFAATPFNYPKPNPDLIAKPSRPNSFIAQQFSSLNLGHKTHKTRNPPSLVDTRLQAKAMTTSAIVDSPSKFSLLKPNTHNNSNNTRLAPELEKEGGTKRSSKEKPQKSKLHGLVKNEKKGYLVEDVKIEKSRNHDIVEEHGDDDVNKRRSAISVSGARRRSLCGSHVDLGDVFAINGVKMVSADMPPFMQIHAVDCARKAFDSMEKFTSKTLASSLKKEFDGVYGPAWHCIVGTSFGSYVTHSVGGFLYFSMDQKLYILLFKTAVQKVN